MPSPPGWARWPRPAASVCLDLRPYWMGKASIFRFPFGGVMRWLGGIAVDRSKSTNLVAASALHCAAAPTARDAADRAARGHARQGAALENGLLLHRPAGAGAHHPGLSWTTKKSAAAWGPSSRPPATWMRTWRRSNGFLSASRGATRRSLRRSDRAVLPGR
jgi:hypothetical protein